MNAGEEAMILYDMDVAGLGSMRIVEHFTVSCGRIVRLRQIHDTAAFGAMRQRIFDALTNLDGLTGWWATTASGSASAGGEFEHGTAGVDEIITMRLDRELKAGSAEWTCLGHPRLPDWEGTKIRLTFTDEGADETMLLFEHIGLVPESVCYEPCRAGWELFLPSLRGYVERERGCPLIRALAETIESAGAKRWVTPIGTGRVRHGERETTQLVADRGMAFG